MAAADAWGLSNPSLAGEGEVVVFTEHQANAVRVTALSRAAMAVRLSTGLTLADARARVPGLVAVPRDPAAERRLLGRVIAVAQGFSPVVMAEPPDGAVIDLTGCAHLFGGEAGLVADLLARIARLSATVRYGIGHTPEAARARARFAAAPEADLLALPVEALEAPPETTLALRRAGLKRIADLATRPRRMLAARFGDLPLRLARLLEEEERPLDPDRPLPPVMALRRFAEPIGRVEDGLACLEELLGEAATTLLERHEGGRRFVARFFRSDGAVPVLAVETGRPVRDGAVVMRLFRERLDALADPIDPGFGFDMVRLDVPVTEPLAPAQSGLAGETEDAAPLAELADRLVARLGAAQVARVAPHDSHIPECASVAASPAEAPVWDAPEPGEPPFRPLRLLDPPQPVEVVYALPEGPPKRFVWRKRAHDVARWEGPERIAAEWWRRRIPAETWRRRDASDHAVPLPAGAGGFTRDYYRVEDGAGHRFWLFRHGLQGAETGDPAWYLHGVFA